MTRVGSFVSACALLLLVVGFASRSSDASGSASRVYYGAPAQHSLNTGFDWGEGEGEGHHHLFVRSNTFQDGGRIPLSMVYNGFGCTGGNRSPQLSWYGAPEETQSFTVLLFDVDASFTHWGMYNIPASTRNLPENAGVAGSLYGKQILNDFPAQMYDGPCPPANRPAHEYVITVFALDGPLDLRLPFFGHFPPFPETLLYGLLTERHHILASGHITGFYSH